MAEMSEARRRAQARYRARHKDQIRAATSKWAAANPEKRTEIVRRFRERSPLRVLYINYRSNAKIRGRSFDLDRVLFEDLVTDNCFYCGAAPAPHNGIDRVNNGDGYRFGNVVTCCRVCNLAKRAMSVDEFTAWATRISARLPLWKGFAA